MSDGFCNRVLLDDWRVCGCCWNELIKCNWSFSQQETIDEECCVTTVVADGHDWIRNTIAGLAELTRVEEQSVGFCCNFFVCAGRRRGIAAVG